MVAGLFFEGNLPMKKCPCFSSMYLALVHLGLIVLSCVLGGIIPQGALPQDYRDLFGETFSQVILFAGFDRVFTAWWFILLMGLLLINLFLCSLIRFPSTLKLYREGFTLNSCLLQTKPSFDLCLSPGRARDFLQQLGFAKPLSQTVDGVHYLYQSRRRLGVWGSWLSHLGMLIIVVGFALGQLLHVDTSVYGVPGQTKQVPGMTSQFRSTPLILSCGMITRWNSTLRILPSTIPRTTPLSKGKARSITLLRLTA